MTVPPGLHKRQWHEPSSTLSCDGHMPPNTAHKNDVRGYDILVGHIIGGVFVEKIYRILQPGTCRVADANSNGLAIQFYQPCGNIFSALVRPKYAYHVATVPGTHTDDAHRAMRRDIETLGKMLLNGQ